MTINFETETKEIMEINNIVYSVMPSDISKFSDNALTEEVYFRSKGAFAFRSKHSNSQINLTFPVPLLDPASLDKYTDTERELFDNGINLIAQLNGFPFCFVRSARIYSYMGVSYQTPNDYLMFGVQEIKIVQDTRISGTLLVEVSLLLNNHTNMVKDLSFVSDFSVDKWRGLSIHGTVPNLTDSGVFSNYMNALTGDVMGNYMELLEKVGVVRAGENFNIENTLTSLTIKAPYVSSKDQLKIINNNSEVVLDIEENQIDDIEFESFKMYDKYTNESTFDGGAISEFQAKYVDELDFIKHKENHLAEYRMYYLADQDLFNPAVNAIQSVVLTKTNSFATHHIGSSQHPYLQYMGKFPARMTISSIYNNTGSYEHNQKSTMNLFQVLLNSVDTNNVLYPGANAFNYLKVKSVAGALMGIGNMMPGECTLTSSSESSNVEMFTTTFVENSLNHLIEESKVGVGREIVSTQRQAAAIIAVFLYVNAVKTAIQNETKDKPFNYKAHMVTMNTLAKLAKEMGLEIRGNNQNDVVDTSGNKDIRTEASIKAFLELTTKAPTKENFLKIMPHVDKTIKQLGQRAAIQKHKASKGKDSDGIEGNIKVSNRGKEDKVQSINDTYNFSSAAVSLIEQLTTDIAKMKESGFINLQQSGNIQIKTLQELNDQFLQHSFVGDTQRDLNLEKYQPDVEIRRFLDPFFFVKHAPILNQPDFYEGFNIMGTEAVKNIKAVVSKEINGGVLEGSSNTNELIAEMSELTEKRYTATNAEDRPDLVANAGLDTGSGQNAFGTKSVGTAGQIGVANAALWKAGNICTLSDAMTRRLVASTLTTESGGGNHHGIKNSWGYLGRYQGGAGWLAMAGFIKGGGAAVRAARARDGFKTDSAWGKSGGHKRFLENSNNWLNGMSQSRYLQSPDLQDQSFQKVTSINCNWIKKKYAVNNERQLAALLKTMHLAGPAGVIAVMKGGTGANDGRTSARKYYNDIMKNGDGLDGNMTSKAVSSPTNTKTSSKTTAPNVPEKRNNGTPPPSKKKAVNVTSLPPKDTKVTVTIESVLDGDTIRVSSKQFMPGVMFDMRISGIDAPEIAHGKDEGQYGGNMSHVFANSILRGKTLPARITDISHGRAVGDVKIAGKYFGEIALESGAVYSVNETSRASSANTHYNSLEDKAKADKKGIWKQPDRTMFPGVFRDALKASKMKPQYTENGVTTNSTTEGTSKKPGVNSQGSAKTSVPNYPLQNSFIPIPPKDVELVNSSFGKRINPRTAQRIANGTAGKVGWHYGVDIKARQGVQVKASCDGTISTSTGGDRGNCVTLYCDAQGFQCVYMHLSGFSAIRKGPVNYGDVIGYVGSTGSSTGNHLHYEVKFNNVNVNPFYTMELSRIPKHIPLKSGDYIAKQAFLSSTKLDKTALSGQAGANELYNRSTISASSSVDSVGGRSVDDMTMAEVKGYEIGDVVMDQQMSVFDESLQVVKHVEKMFSNFDQGLNICFPIIKAYAVVGNESDNIFTSEVPLQPALYFDLPPLHDLNVATNNDYNPIDICTFSMVNPNSTRSSTDFYGASDFGANVYNMDTQYYNLFYADRIKLKPGMKIHIKAGYSNSPGKLKTIFNGIIKEVSGAKDLLLNVVCESFGAELLSNSMGYNKPLDMSNGKNASTGLLIAYSLLEDTVSHFGSKPTITKTWMAYDAVIGSTNTAGAFGSSMGRSVFGDGLIGLLKDDVKPEDTGEPVDKFGNPVVEPEVTLQNSGDYRDPESKRLIAPLNWGDMLGAFNPSRANLAQRMFTNIYSDAIEGAHDQYKSDLWTRISKGLDLFDAKMFYKYYAFRSTTWSVLKEMEYRHPGTLAKPLWYDERMTMFYGIKEQLYVAKDLTPSFMFESGKAAKANDVNKPYSGDYLLERHKRLEPATGFHLLSSKLNIINNDLTISRDFATRINVIYFDDEYEGNKIQPESETFTVDLDDNLATFDIREETISLNGCHGKYMSWMYGIQELKKQTETMYKGSITVTGKPDMRAGDYAYLEDSDRGMSGVIKIRECNHHFSSSTGYTTVITPGMHVECTQFYWSSLFTQLGMAAKMSLMKAELNVNHLLTTNKVADSYYEYLKLIQNNQTISFGDQVAGVGGTMIVSGITMMFMWKMGSKSSALKNGMTWAEYNTLWNKAGQFARVSKNYSQILATDVYGRSINSILKTHRNTMATLNAAGPQATHGIPTKILKNIKKMSALKNLGIFKLLKGVPWSAAKGVLGVGATITKGLLGVFAVSPLGAVMTIVGTLLFSVVMSKFRELELTHNPLLMFPITYNGKPYVAGISGYENNSIFEGYIKNLQKNIEIYKKSAQALRATSQGTSAGATATEVGLNTVASLSKVIEASSLKVASYISGPPEQGY